MESEIAVLSQGSSPLLYRVYFWGIEVIRAIQTIETPALTAVIKVITEMGAVPFYLAALLFLYWCVDEKQGFRLTLLVILSGWCNGALKHIFAQPRPYHLAPDTGLAAEPTYGFPSGHAQLSLVFWFALAGYAKNRFGKAAFFFAAVPVLLIAFTRLYLGVHFPTDILGGWFFGAAFLLLFLFAEKRPPFRAAASGETGSAAARFQILLAAAAAFLMLNTAGAEENVAGLFFGFCAGRVLCARRIGFSAALPPETGTKKRVIVLLFRYAAGIAIFFALQLLLSLVLPGPKSLFQAVPFWGADSPLLRMGRFVRYGLLGFYAAFAAPWLFIKMGLASGGGRGAGEVSPS